MTELFAGKTSYWLVLSKSGGGTAGAVGGTCCPGGDGGAASWAVFLGSGDLALAARCHEGGGVVAGASCCSVLFGGAGVAGARVLRRRRMARFARRA